MRRPGPLRELAGLAGPFTKIARTMASQHDIEVIPSGFECKTDGKRIWVPFTADCLAEDKRQILHGHLDHEVCHVMEERAHRAAGEETPITILGMLARAPGKRSKNTALIFNALEDVRIERKYATRYPGMAENLREANRASAESMRAMRPARGFWVEFACAMILRARGFSSEGCDIAVLPYLELIQGEIDAISKCQWGSEVLVLAQAILDKVCDKAKEAKEEADKPAPPPPAPPPVSDEEDAAEDDDGGADDGGAAGDGGEGLPDDSPATDDESPAKPTDGAPIIIELNDGSVHTWRFVDGEWKVEVSL